MGESSEQQLRAHRQVFWDAWTKAQAGMPLDALEERIAQCIGMHQEYHPLFNDRETFLTHTVGVDDGMNPYLHPSLHLALEEQLATHQPPESVQALETLMRQRGLSRHDALHVLLEALAEEVYYAQRQGREPDVAAYRLKLRGFMNSH